MPSYLLHHLLRDTSRKYPDRSAVIFNNMSMDYLTLEQKSNQMARVLSAMGVGNGSRVGIMMNKSMESIISIFGILKTGAVYVPIDPKAPRDRVYYIITNCEIKWLISSAKCLETIDFKQHHLSSIRSILMAEGGDDARMAFENGPGVISWDALSDQRDGALEADGCCDQDPAYILFTSGSTGMPKGVVISHLNSLSFINSVTDHFKISEQDRIASHAPLHFDLSVFDIFSAVKCASAVVLIPEFFSTFPMKLAEYVSTRKVTIWNSVSSALVMLVEMGKLEKFDFQAMRLVHFSGDVMPVKYLRRLKEQFSHAAFYNIYGQSEANSSMCYEIGDITKDDNWKIPLGKPLPNFQAFALDENSRVITKPGEKGELYIKSATIALGYWRDEQRTRESFICDPTGPSSNVRVYRTGDMVRIDDNLDYVFAGRKDAMIKSRGYRVELDEIDLVLNSHPTVNQAVTIPVPDDLIGNRIISYATLTEGGDITEKDLIRHCSKTLPSYMIPEVIHIIPAMPRTSSGKVDRKMLEKETVIA